MTGIRFEGSRLLRICTGSAKVAIGNVDAQEKNGPVRSLGTRLFAPSGLQGGGRGLRADGNVPPDFLVEGRVAVEVRRLNQHWEAGSGDLEPIEKLSMPLLIRFKKFLETFGPPCGPSWYVFHRFERPQLTRDWEPILRTEFQPFRDGKVQEGERTIHIDAHFNVRLVRLAAPGSSTFIWGGGSDFDRGGWVIPELEKNLAICIAEKSVKIADYRDRYPKWWLVLVDHMVGGTPEPVQVKHDWDKVLIIHPSNWEWGYEVAST